MSRREHKPTTGTQPTTRARATPSKPKAAAAAAGAPAPERYHDSLPVRHRHAAGIDVGSRSHWAAAPGPDGTVEVAEFDTYTDGLHALVAWLRARGVTTVAPEATGIYGETLLALLQAAGPRPTGATASGSSACTPTACCRPPSGRRPTSPCSAATCGSGPSWSRPAAATASMCRRPWSR
jgi:hypothetical protein